MSRCPLCSLQPPGVSAEGTASDKRLPQDSQTHPLLQVSPGLSTDLALVRPTPALALPEGLYFTSNYKELREYQLWFPDN